MTTKGITIRFGAAHNSVSVGSVTVDLSVASKTQRYEARRGLIEGLKQDGYFGRKEQRRANYRAHREATNG